MDEKGDDVIGMDDEQEAQRVSLREKLNAMKEQAAGIEKQSFQKDRVREETL